MSCSKISFRDNKTIFAPSTPMIFSAIAVLRISGKLAKNVFEILRTNINISSIKERVAYFTKIFDESNEVIDSCIIIFFAGPRSFTGEDVVEIQTHGSPLIIKIICSILSKQEGFIYAENGEFSRRAVKNNKIDIVQAEGLLKLIHSETKSQLSLANQEFYGEKTKKFNILRDEIINIFGMSQALLDFPEDDLDDFDINKDLISKRKISSIELSIKKELEKILSKLKLFLVDSDSNQKIEDGFKILILGKPNVGKSSLLNYLSKEDIAIVSDIPGTTRDLLEIRLDINGYLVKIIDSAGIRDINSDDSNSKIEKIGIDKALKKIEESDIILYIIDSNEYSLNSLKNTKILDNILSDIKNKNIIFLLSKSDNDECTNSYDIFFHSQLYKIIPISSLYQKGLNILNQEIALNISSLFKSNDHLIASYRQKQIISDLILKSEYIIKNFEIFEYFEIIAEEIRSLISLSASLTETILNDEVLDNIFTKFCIGK